MNEQLSEHLHVEEHHTKRCWGLCARLYSKLAAYTLWLVLNRATGATDTLPFKQLAFSI